MFCTTVTKQTAKAKWLSQPKLAALIACASNLKPTAIIRFKTKLITHKWLIFGALSVLF